LGCGTAVPLTTQPDGALTIQQKTPSVNTLGVIAASISKAIGFCRTNMTMV